MSSDPNQKRRDKSADADKTCPQRNRNGCICMLRRVRPCAIVHLGAFGDVVEALVAIHRCKAWRRHGHLVNVHFCILIVSRIDLIERRTDV